MFRPRHVGSNASSVDRAAAGNRLGDRVASVEFGVRGDVGLECFDYRPQAGVGQFKHSEELAQSEQVAVQV